MTAPAALADALRDRYLVDRELGRGGIAVAALRITTEAARALEPRLKMPYL